MLAQAGIQFPCPRLLDSRLRGNDARIQVLAVYVRNGQLVIINDLHVLGIVIAPFKTNAPLVVNANTVLTLTVAEQFFQVVGWWYT